MKKAVLFTILLAILPILALRAEVSLKAEINKNKVSLDEPIVYKITLSVSENKMPALKLPSLDSFNILSRSNSSSLSFKGNQISNAVVYAFVLVGKEAGKFKIGPAVVELNNKSYESQSFEIEITPGKNIPRKNQPPQKKRLPLTINNDEPQVNI